MKNKVVISLSLAAALLTLSNPSFAAQDCASVFSPALPQESGWRKDATHPLKSGATAPTSNLRETEMSNRSKLMENEVLGIGMHGDTPPLEFFAADGVKEVYLAHSKGDGIVTRMAISNLGASGLLKGTLLLPVSGHTGAANAKSWSKTDTYTIRWDVSTDSTGQKWTASHYGENAPALITDAKSLDLVTAHEVEVTLVKGHVMRFIYFRSGSGGPAGYYDGRVLELVWDGT